MGACTPPLRQECSRGILACQVHPSSGLHPPTGAPVPILQSAPCQGKSKFWFQAVLQHWYPMQFCTQLLDSTLPLSEVRV
jgi:hypothetical protein